MPMGMTKRPKKPLPLPKNANGFVNYEVDEIVAKMEPNSHRHFILTLDK